MNDYTKLIDVMLEKVTMYRSVLYGLCTIAGMALILMVIGYFSYSPFAFLLTLMVVVGGSYLFNRLLGALYGMKPHGESALITGLILTLLFTPSLSPITLATLLLIAAVAQASKYIIVWRGKHLFNPAAIAIVIAAIAHIGYATWWIATPAMMPIVLFVALLVLYKTQKLTMALVYIGASLLGTIVQASGTEQSVMQALIVALVSGPLIFAAGIMLSEPLTLPPRKQQQLLVAAFVGFIGMAIAHIGSVTMTPAVALVLGNACAFMFTIRRGVSLRLVDKKRIGSDGYELTFDTKPFAFEPGQYMEVWIPHAHKDSRGDRRVFTIIGRPQAEQVSIATRVPAKHSSFKRAMIAMKKSQSIAGVRVAGDFTLPKDQSIPVVFIAGGVGITPAISFLMNGAKRHITLIYAVRSVEDMMFVDELERYECTVVVVTPDDRALPSADWIRGGRGLTAEILRPYIEKESHVYISGPTAMVTNTKSIVKSMQPARVNTDHFTGY